jgi:hypothetical protein
MDRIFPHNENDPRLAKDKHFNGVDWDAIEDKISAMTEVDEELVTASDEDVEADSDNEEVEAESTDEEVEASSDDEEVEAESDEETTEASSDEEVVEASSDDEGVVNAESDGETTEAGCNCGCDHGEKEMASKKRKRKRRSKKERKEEYFKNKKKSKMNREEQYDQRHSSDESDEKRVIAFTSEDQLSAAACVAAKEAGDMELYNTILAARQARRVQLAANLDFNSVRTANSAVNDFVKEASDEQVAEDAPQVKAVSDFNESEKTTFAKIAEAEGFPEEYIAWMANGGSEPSGEYKQIIELVESDMTKEAKLAVVENQIRTAKLTEDDLSRLKDYWINQLGYEKEWVDDLFTNKYGK